MGGGRRALVLPEWSTSCPTAAVSSAKRSTDLGDNDIVYNLILLIIVGSWGTACSQPVGRDLRLTDQRRAYYSSYYDSS